MVVVLVCFPSSASLFVCSLTLSHRETPLGSRDGLPSVLPSLLSTLFLIFRGETSALDATMHAMDASRLVEPHRDAELTPLVFPFLGLAVRPQSYSQPS